MSPMLKKKFWKTQLRPKSSILIRCAAHSNTSHKRLPHLAESEGVDSSSQPINVPAVILVWGLFSRCSSAVSGGVIPHTRLHPARLFAHRWWTLWATLRGLTWWGSGFMTKKGGNERFQECKNGVNIQHLLSLTKTLHFYSSSSGYFW